MFNMTEFIKAAFFYVILFGCFKKEYTFAINK